MMHVAQMRLNVSTYFSLGFLPRKHYNLIDQNHDGWWRAISMGSSGDHRQDCILIYRRSKRSRPQFYNKIREYRYLVFMKVQEKEVININKGGLTLLN